MRVKRSYEQIESINWKEEFPEVPSCVHEAVTVATAEILSQKESRGRQKEGKHIPAKRMFLLAAVITLLSGMTVVAATSLWKQRMEAMNQEEMEEYFLSIASSTAPAFRYNRAMSEEERTRFDELTVKYEEQGLFPKDALTMLSSVDAYKGKNVGYEKKSGTFFLPEEVLSDEQLLQIIDFYHKTEYSVAGINETTDDEKIEEILEEEVIKNVDRDEGQIMEEYEPLNAAVSYFETSMQGEELLSDIAAGGEYLYLGFKTEIKRMPLGSSVTEDFYELKENETLFALSSDEDDNVYLSLREYHAENDTYNNRLLKLNAEGEAVLEYHLESAVYSEEGTLKDAIAHKMLADENGQLYVKGTWSSDLVVFVFDAEGNCIKKLESQTHKAHPANGMCLGFDDHLYLLADEVLVKLDAETKEVSEMYNYWSEDMVAAVDIVYSMGADSFYVVSYDGLFQYTLGEEGSVCLLAPYESEVFSEGYRCEPISEDKLVIVNATDYENFKYKVTYLSLKEQ